VSLDGLDHVERWMGALQQRPALLRGIEVPVEREDIVDDDDATEKFVEKARTMLQR
jgi:glutathione S-transferase/GST-like protein